MEKSGITPRPSEAPNLLAMDGQRYSTAREGREPQVELQPGDSAGGWRSGGLHPPGEATQDAAAEALKATDAKDPVVISRD
jgi:hypothetical protein